MAASVTGSRESRSAHRRTSAVPGTSIPHIRSSARSSSHQNGVAAEQISRTLRIAPRATASVLAQGELPIPIPFKTKVYLPTTVTQGPSTEMQPKESTAISEIAGIHLLLSIILERMDATRTAPALCENSSKEELITVEVEVTPIMEQLVRSPIESTATMLRVGSLKLDLINRTARRGNRSFNLRLCEFRLLKYMMQRGGQLLTRAKFFEEVWNYKFTPKANLVDVQLGRLRRKVDASDEGCMTHNVRGAGFALRAAD
jgi:hypothetical protein